MFPFLLLPPELRNSVYHYCLVTSSAIDLCALRTNRAERPRLPDVGLFPRILQLNRQVHDEASSILYKQNFFFAQPVAGLKASAASEKCLVCPTERRAKSEHMPELSSPDQGWIQSIRLVRRLIVVMSPYTLLEWNGGAEKQPPSRPSWCSHTWHHMLPPTLDLSLAVLHRGQRSLMDRFQAVDEDNWYAMAFRYGTSHAQEWRSLAKRDLDISMAGLIAYALQNSTHIILSGHGRSPVYYQPHPAPCPQWLARILATGSFLPELNGPDDVCGDPVEHLPHFTREYFRRKASAQMDLLVRPLVNDLVPVLLRGRVRGC